MNLIYIGEDPNEKDLSTQQSKAQPEVRIPGADEDPRRKNGIKTPQGKRPAQADGIGRKEALLGWKKDRGLIFGFPGGSVLREGTRYGSYLNSESR
jgi:hypothetical protein